MTSEPRNDRDGDMTSNREEHDLRSIPGSNGCSRQSLVDLANRYVEALLAHEPARLPLAADVRFTENGQALQPGDALWKTVTGATDYRIHVADPDTGEVCFLALVLENDMPALLGVRLKTNQDRQIVEIETLAGRRGHGTTERPRRLVMADPLFSVPLAPEERLPRERMIAIADSYFEGLVDAAIHPPFDAQCDRVENAVQTTNRPDAAAVWAAWSCEQQYHAGFSKIVEATDDRRYPAVDAEKGLVYAMIIMRFTGSIRSVKLSDGSTFVVPAPYLEPRSLLAHEVFKICSGRIRRLESMYVTVPYGSRSGW